MDFKTAKNDFSKFINHNYFELDNFRKLFFNNILITIIILKGFTGSKESLTIFQTSLKQRISGNRDPIFTLQKDRKVTENLLFDESLLKIFNAGSSFG